MLFVVERSIFWKRSGNALFWTHFSWFWTFFTSESLLIFMKKWDQRKSPDNRKVWISDVRIIEVQLYSCRQWYASLQWLKCCATNWATSQSPRFALVIECVSSVHPWANSSCWISQSECAFCFSYVINFTGKHFGQAIYAFIQYCLKLSSVVSVWQFS